jgi:hypothetical protein
MRTRLTERDLSRIVRRVIMEQDSTTTTGSAKPSPGQTTKPGVPGQAPTSPTGVKTVQPKITIDCGKKLITNSGLPKLDAAANSAIINHYCQAGKV